LRTIAAGGSRGAYEAEGSLEFSPMVMMMATDLVVAFLPVDV